MQDDSIDFDDLLEDRLNLIKNRRDLEKYIDLLISGYKDGEFEEQNVVEYLEGAEAVIGALDSLARNAGYTEDPEEASWLWFARILTAAFAHS